MFIFHGSLTWVSGILKSEEVIILLYYYTLTGGMDLSKSWVLLKIQINTQVISVLLWKHDIPSLCETNSQLECELLLSDFSRRNLAMLF